MNYNFQRLFNKQLFLFNLGFLKILKYKKTYIERKWWKYNK